MVDIDWNGDHVGATITAAAFAGLELAGQHLLRASRARAPHQEGTLERSGTSTSDEATNTVVVAYDTVYALRQHEELTWRHKPGRTAKYLENPMMEERETMLAMIAATGGEPLR